MPSKRQAEKRWERKNEIPATITFDAQSLDLTANSETTGSAPKFEMLAYSGGKLFVAGYKHPVVVDLDGLERSENVSVLLDHSPKKRVGHIENIMVANNQIRAFGVISAASEDATEVLTSHRNGFRWQVSIGCRVLEAFEVARGKTVVINGQPQSGPLIVAARSKLREISFVGVGGDEGNTVAIAAAADCGDLPMEFKEWLEARGLDQSTLTDEQVTVLQAAYEKEPKDVAESKVEPAVTPEVETPDVVAQLRAEAAAESKRISAIRKMCVGHPDIEAQAIAEGWTEVNAEVAVLRAEREATEKTSGPAIHVSGRSVNQEVDGQALEASLCMQLGVEEKRAAQGISEQAMDVASGKKYRRIGLQSLIYRTLAASGKHFTPGEFGDDTIRDFLHCERDLQASAPGTFSYLSTSGILSNTANKLLLQSFDGARISVPTLFGKRSVSDFKQHTAYRLAMNGDLLEVGPGGDIKHHDLAQESFTSQAKTWGRMLTLTRTDMINDDLGAFEQIPRILGRKAALTLEKQGWTLVLSNPSGFFTSANSASGTSTALQISSLTTAEQKMLDQTDAAGDPILMSGRYLVTGTALAATAVTLMGEQRIIATNYAGSASTTAPALNPHAGKWTPIASPYINALSLTGSSATLWYLWGDPMDQAPFVVSYLNGREQPTIESSEVDFNKLGMSWRVVFDFGVDDAESRAIVKMAGA